MAQGASRAVFPLPYILLEPKPNTTLNELVALFPQNLSISRSTPHHAVLAVNNPSQVFSIANALYESGLVQWCHPDFIIPTVFTGEPYIPNDTWFPQQLNLHNPNGIDIDAPEAWAITKGNACIRIGIVDSGVEDLHTDLQANMLEGYTPGNPTGLGRPNYADPITEYHVHGTQSAGLIVAKQDNYFGISGIAPECKGISFNIFDGVGDKVDAFEKAWSVYKVDILTNSWVFPCDTGIYPLDALTVEINKARTLGRNGRGCPVIFSSGNRYFPSTLSNPQYYCDPTETRVFYPANLPGVITVGAIYTSGVLAAYSCRGPEMDLVAPVNVPTTSGVTYDKYNYIFSSYGGTSAAAPQVAGVAALMLSANPYLTEEEVRTILNQTATDMGQQGFDNDFGYGRVNAHRAVEEAKRRYEVLNQIAGKKIICYNEIATYTPPPGQTFSDYFWQVVGEGLEIVSGQGTSQLQVKNISPSPNNAATIKFAGTAQPLAINHCTLSGVPILQTYELPVWLGVPNPPTLSIFTRRDGYYPTWYPNPIVDAICLDGNTRIQAYSWGTSLVVYHWQVEFWQDGQLVQNYITTNSGYLDFYNINVQVPYNTVNISVYAENSCGGGLTATRVNIPVLSSCHAPYDPYTDPYNPFYNGEIPIFGSPFGREAGNLQVYPNPASSQLDVFWGVSKSDSSGKVSTPNETQRSASSTQVPVAYTIRLYNNRGELVYETESSQINISLNISQLPEGIYSLVATRPNEIQRKNIVIRR